MLLRRSTFARKTSASGVCGGQRVSFRGRPAGAWLRDWIPEFRWDNGLWMEFPFMEVGEVTDAVTEEVAGEVTGEVASEVTDPVTDPVDRLLLTVGSATLAPSEIQQRLGLRHRPTFRENYLRPALRLKLLEMTFPDKPGSRLQRYRLTDKGRARLTELKPENSQ